MVLVFCGSYIILRNSNSAICSFFSLLLTVIINSLEMFKNDEMFLSMGIIMFYGACITNYGIR